MNKQNYPAVADEIYPEKFFNARVSTQQYYPETD